MATTTKDKGHSRNIAQDRAAPVTTSSRKAAVERGRQTSGPAEITTRSAAVPVPILTPRLKVYQLRLAVSGPSSIGQAGRRMAGRLPPPKQLAFYGALGVAAVLGAIDWPVAAAIGIGTALAGRG
jgi:hypothetical protein